MSEGASYVLCLFHEWLNIQKNQINIQTSQTHSDDYPTSDSFMHAKPARLSG